MTITAILIFAITELVLSLSPGPAVVIVLSQGMKAGFRGIRRGILGILTGELIFFTLSAVGLGTLLIASQSIFLLIKWIGAGVKLAVTSH